MNPEPVINTLFALRDRLGERATITQAIGVLELIAAGDHGLTAGGLKVLAQTCTPSTHFANSLVKAGLARKSARQLVATPRALDLLKA